LGTKLHYIFHICSTPKISYNIGKTDQLTENTKQGFNDKAKKFITCFQHEVKELINATEKENKI